ncbi:MAG: SDR family oxidoreductase [Pseudomonadota bacterium]
MTGRLAILGAAGALGRALTRQALETGWTVTALDLPATLEAYPPGPDVSAIPVDVREPDRLRAAFDALGPIDGFVNLAGFMSPVRPLSETPLEIFDEVVAGNLRGAVVAAQAALPGLRAARGAMVNVASGLAAQPRPGFAPYAAAKAGMVNLTKLLAQEAAPEVRVNAVGPSAVDTDFLRGGAGRPAREKEPVDLARMAAMTPLGRIATPEDVAGPILFLLSPAAGFMTGQTLWVNGGSYMP